MDEGDLLSDHVAKSVIFFIDGEYCRVLYLRLYFFNNPVKEKEMMLIY